MERFVAEDMSRALVVVAHPDDAEYGISCAVAQWTAEGKDVHYFLLTSGEAGIQSLAPKKCGPLRAREQRNACAAVGVTGLRIADFRDGYVEWGLELRQAIAEEIRRIKPDTVVISTYELEVPWGFNHVDHRAVGLAAIDAIRDAANPWVFPDTDDEAHEVKTLLISGAAEPTHAVTVSDKAFQKGIKSLAAHEEYLKALPDHPSPKELMENVTIDVDGARAVGFSVHDMA